MPFVKRHKVLSALFLFSIFVMVKNSSIPYLFTPPTFIEFIFDAPQSCFFSSIAQMVDTFASAYVTSLMFYYMVDFLPVIKQEKKAKEILAPKLVNLYLYISELLAMIEYSAKQEHLLQTGDIADMDKLNFRSKDVFCKRKSFKNEEETGVAAHSYNLLKDCNKYKALILDTCNAISGVPNFSYCDTSVIHIISEIQLSELLLRLPKPDYVALQPDGVDIVYMGLGEGYQHLKSVYSKLSSFVEPRLACEMIDISQQEIDTWLKQQAEALKQYPELAQILIVHQKHNQ